ncbi:hypothetical protein F2Q69_00022197 [Brassica cretica]|uniref:Uncharacterized protein n=1 Tax=Brassica cretica TaxID=69181 RepID=A0A8S9QCI6_BRACR|nr:hypothetical protein F2Q69_00022197 [Brassica cretica]
MSSFSQMLGVVYNEQKGEFETMSTHIKKPDIQSTDESRCYLTSDVDKEITIEYFLELKEFLELEDGEKLEYWDTDREVTMEDFLELEEGLDSEHKLDDNQYTMRIDLETSPKTNIDHHPPNSIDRHLSDCIDQHLSDCIDLPHPPNIDRHPSLDELP